MNDTNRPERARGPSVTRWLKRAAITFAVLLVFGIGFIGFAEHRTSQPDFCGSCHIMDSYHESWQADMHGTKLGVACVECHYAPGERTTIKAKMRGLSQLASYVSGRYGSTRPRAHVSNDSCMTSKCHGDNRFMDKVINIGTIKFTHASHLGANPKRQEEIKQQLEALSKKIRTEVGDQRFAELEEAANVAGAAEPRIEQLTNLTKSWNIPVKREDLQEFSQLQHRNVRFLQLMDIQCTNCHSYASPNLTNGQEKQTHHFAVSTTACFTCHFNNEGFNTGTNSCLMCHALPVGDITIHQQLTAQESGKLQSPELTTKPIKMNHQSILERKVNCISCHADVASQDSQVTRRDCERCHDRPTYFAEWKEPFTLDLVAKYHRVHVPNQRAKCLDCHSEIHHQLIRPVNKDGSEPKDNGHSAQFLSSVMANCTHCHPKHHSDQINLLAGIGGATVAHSDPNMMFGSRTNCYGCHTELDKDAHGGEVARATLNGCVACHGDRHSDTFEKWKQGLELVQIDADEAYAKAAKMLEESPKLPAETNKEVAELLATARADLQLVKRGNGLHNVTYAMELLDGVTQRAQQAVRTMTEANPAP